MSVGGDFTTVSNLRCWQCPPEPRNLVSVCYVVDVPLSKVAEVRDALADAIVDVAEKYGALANGGVRPESVFERRCREGLSDPEFRKGWAEGKREILFARLDWRLRTFLDALVGPGGVFGTRIRETIATIRNWR
jgi:hypothetical protein